MLILLAMLGVMISGVMAAKDSANVPDNTVPPGSVLHRMSSYVSVAGTVLHTEFHRERRKNDA